MTMAVLALLAYKAVKHFGGGQPGAHSAPPPFLATLNAGAAVAAAARRPPERRSGRPARRRRRRKHLSGGLGDLLKQFQHNGQGELANSWVGNGQNKPISPDDLASALGADQINALISQTGSVARRICCPASASICPRWSTI